jgi:hypothetical protein
MTTDSQRKSTPFRKGLALVAPVGVVLVMVFIFSGFYARRECDETIRAEIAPPPRYSTRFVLRPAKHMADAGDLGFKPGWLVTYATRSKTYGTAFFVGLSGKILARGTPTIVASVQSQARAGIQRFAQAFSKIDSVVTLGSKYSAALPLLGAPVFTSTNESGLLTAYFSYQPRDMERTSVALLTNGFSLTVSNDIIIQKDYAFTSNR